MVTIETRNHLETSLRSAEGGVAISQNIEDLQVFDISLYRDLFNKAASAGLTTRQAQELIFQVITNDGVGVVTENISGAQDKYGNYIFDVENRIRMQLTPPKHYYFHDKDLDTGEDMMVAPEHRWGIFKKDILEVISNWRRGMDKVGMAIVRSLFLDSTKPLQANEYLIWGSPKAEKWEGASIVKYNGAYGFLYVGKMVNLDGVEVLEVHDFKNALDARSYNLFFEGVEGEIYTDSLYLKHPLVDKVKATVVRTNGDWSIENVWRKLAELQRETTGESEIFNLPVDSIIALQEPGLHERIRNEVAVAVAQWISEEIYKGTADSEIQDRVKQKFINATLRLINGIQEERAQERYAGEKTIRYLNTTIPLERYTNSIDPAILARYTGSNGDGCGSWGGNNSNSIFTSYNSPIRGFSSVEVMSSLFGSCKECSGSLFDNHYHCPECKKPYADETHKTTRTPTCSCGFEFGC